MSGMTIVGCAAIVALAASVASGAIVSRQMSAVDISVVAGSGDRELGATLSLPVETGAEVGWAHLELEVRPVRLQGAANPEEMLCLGLWMQDEHEAGGRLLVGEYRALPGAEKTLVFDVTGLVRRWLVSPELPRSVTLRGCDSEEDACTLQSVQRNGVNGRIVVGYGR